jgi:hypothetical protein
MSTPRSRVVSGLAGDDRAVGVRCVKKGRRGGVLKPQKPDTRRGRGVGVSTRAGYKA